MSLTKSSLQIATVLLCSPVFLSDALAVEAKYKTKDAEWYEGQFRPLEPGEPLPTYCESKYGKSFFSAIALDNKGTSRVICGHPKREINSSWNSLPLDPSLTTEFELRKNKNETLPPSKRESEIETLTTFSKEAVARHKNQARCPEPTRAMGIRVDYDYESSLFILRYQCFSNLYETQICTTKKAVADLSSYSGGDGLAYEVPGKPATYLSLVKVPQCTIPVCPEEFQEKKIHLNVRGKKYDQNVCVFCPKGEFDQDETYGKFLAGKEPMPSSPLCKLTRGR